MANLTMKMLQTQIDELRDEIVRLKSVSNIKKVSFKGLEIGDTFELAGLNWKILNITDKGYMCLADKLEKRMEFDSDFNDWKSSNLRNYLNTDFLKLIVEEIGAGNIIEFERDLISLDGQTEYGTCTDKVSLLTVDEYRKYRSLIPNTNDYWWWLISPWSTKSNGYEKLITVVSSSGDFNFRDYFNRLGVRPFCIFSSSIFESEE